MAEVSGTATSYDIDNIVAPRLFLSSTEPRTFLQLVGASLDVDGESPITTAAGRVVQSNNFTLSAEVDLDAPSQPGILDGADASFDEHDVSSTDNAVQIFQEGVAISYSAQSTQEQVAEIGTTGVANVPGAGQGDIQFLNSVMGQLALKVRQIKRDMNFTFLRGTYNVGAAATARATRGLRSALSTNVFANAGTPRDLTTTIFEAALKDSIANGAWSPGERVVALGDADQFENLIDLYEANADAPRARSEAGLQIRTIWTKWGPVDVAYEADMAAGELVLFQPQFTQPVFRLISREGEPAGTIIMEPLSKSGAADKWQVYLEAGIDYGAEWKHAVIDDLNA